MGGKRYYTFKADQSLLARLTDTDVQFFMVDTETLDRTQVAWLDREMARSEARWKIPAFHRPIYTSGRYATPARLFRAMLEPVFLRHDVRLALSGHEHFYERIRPQQGITYFISGGAGSLRADDIRRTPLTAVGFDVDYHFMLFEVTRDELFYQAISRTGHSVDAGSIKRTRPAVRIYPHEPERARPRLQVATVVGRAVIVGEPRAVEQVAHVGIGQRRELPAKQRSSPFGDRHVGKRGAFERQAAHAHAAR